MKISDQFPSKYLKASDLPDEGFVKAIIDGVQLDEIGDKKERKPVLCFSSGVKKGLVLNKTNSTIIADAYGDDSDAWEGRPILLYATETNFQGKPCPCIRVRIPKAKPAPEQLPPTLEPTEEEIAAAAQEWF